MNVYLAGGFRSGWQDKIKQSCPDFSFFDPRLKPERDWTTLEIGTWDFCHIKKADIIFAYMERTNPSGIGLAVEIGYAYGIGKTVILVLEENNEIMKDKYLAFMEKAADVTFRNFEDGIGFLQSFNSWPFMKRK